MESELHFVYLFFIYMNKEIKKFFFNLFMYAMYVCMYVCMYLFIIFDLIQITMHNNIIIIIIIVLI